METISTSSQNDSYKRGMQKTDTDNKSEQSLLFQAEQNQLPETQQEQQTSTANTPKQSLLFQTDQNQLSKTQQDSVNTNVKQTPSSHVPPLRGFCYVNPTELQNNLKKPKPRAVYPVTSPKLENSDVTLQPITSTTNNSKQSLPSQVEPNKPFCYTTTSTAMPPKLQNPLNVSQPIATDAVTSLELKNSDAKTEDLQLTEPDNKIYNSLVSSTNNHADDSNCDRLRRINQELHNSFLRQSTSGKRISLRVVRTLVNQVSGIWEEIKADLTQNKSSVNYIISITTNLLLLLVNFNQRQEERDIFSQLWKIPIQWLNIIMLANTTDSDLNIYKGISEELNSSLREVLDEESSINIVKYDSNYKGSLEGRLSNIQEKLENLLPQRHVTDTTTIPESFGNYENEDPTYGVAGLLLNTQEKLKKLREQPNATYTTTIPESLDNYEDDAFTYGTGVSYRENLQAQISFLTRTEGQMLSKMPHQIFELYELVNKRDEPDQNNKFVCYLSKMSYYLGYQYRRVALCSMLKILENYIPDAKDTNHLKPIYSDAANRKLLEKITCIKCPDGVYKLTIPPVPWSLDSNDTIRYTIGGAIDPASPRIRL